MPEKNLRLTKELSQGREFLLIYKPQAHPRSYSERRMGIGCGCIIDIAMHVASLHLKTLLLWEFDFLNPLCVSHLILRE